MMQHAGKCHYLEILGNTHWTHQQLLRQLVISPNQLSKHIIQQAHKVTEKKGYCDTINFNSCSQKNREGYWMHYFRSRSVKKLFSSSEILKRFLGNSYEPLKSLSRTSWEKDVFLMCIFIYLTHNNWMNHENESSSRFILSSSLSFI